MGDEVQTTIVMTSAGITLTPDGRLRVLTACCSSTLSSCFGVSSVQKEKNRVPPPWGEDTEEALMPRAESIRKQSMSAPRRRWLSRYRSITVRGLWLIMGIMLVWFLLAFAMRHSNAAGLRAIRGDLDRSSSTRYYAAAGKAALAASHLLRSDKISIFASFA